MEKAALEKICGEMILEKPPARLVKLASSLLAQSRPKFLLKGTQETARPYICCALAVTELQDAIGYDDPQFKPPLPQPQFKKLMAMFAKALLDDAPDPGQPRDPAPQPSPSKRKFPEPEKPTVIQQAKKLKGSDPKNEFRLFANLHKQLDLTPEIVEAMASTQQRFKEHATDHWGLAMAIAFIIIQRAAPEKSNNLMDVIVDAATCSAPKERLEAWLAWANDIVNGQRELCKIAVVPEPVIQIHGSVGGWSFPLEDDRWWEQNPVKEVTPSDGI